MSFTKKELHEILLRNDLAYFGEKMLGMEIAEHHVDWSELASDSKNTKIGILASRDHGKSFFFSFAYAIWRTYYAWMPPLPSKDFKSIPRQPLGYIFSASQDKAIEFLDMIKTEIMDNPKLARIKPKKGGVWSKTEIQCANSSVVRARGWGVAVRGGHPTWAVADDVLNDENIYSEVTRNKSIDYFYSAVTPMVIPNGQTIVVGTPMSSQDLYNSLKNNSEYLFKSYPAIKEDGSALWPTRYSVGMLKKRRAEIGSVRFAREYGCVPVSDESSLFPFNILKENFYPEESLKTTLTDEEHLQYNVFTGVDLAMSSSIGADYTVITTIGVDKDKNRRLLDIRRFKGRGMSDQLREIQDVYFAFRPQKILIEDNQFQRVFRDELITHTDMPVSGHTTTGRNKNSLESGIPSLQVLFENKKFIIPRKTERDRRITDILLNELQCFTYVNGKLEGVGSHDDCVLSLWITNEAASSASFAFSF